MPANTVIVAYRNRQRSLSTFLPLFEAAARQAKESPRLVICDAGTEDHGEDVFNEWKSSTITQATWLSVPAADVPPGPFNKCRTLNTCLTRVRTPLVTMLDVDAMVSPEFFSFIEHFYKHNPVSKKICHRVRLFSKAQYSDDFRVIRRNTNRYRLAKEYFWVRDRIMRTREIPESDRNPLMYNTCAIGNSHYTCAVQQVMDMGGYNTAFAGWGWEDVEFNFRYWHRYRNGYLYTGVQYLVMNRSHDYTQEWSKETNEQDNLRLFEDLQARGFPTPARDANWAWNVNS